MAVDVSIVPCTDIEVYPVVEDGTIHGHSEVWIAIKKKEKNI